MRLKDDQRTLIIDDFLMSNDVVNRWEAQMLPAKLMTEEPEEAVFEYKQEHMEYFSDFGYPWPPSAEELEATIVSQPLSRLGKRAREVLYFCCKSFPMAPESDFEFVDVLPQIARLIGEAKHTQTDRSHTQPRPAVVNHRNPLQ